MMTSRCYVMLAVVLVITIPRTNAQSNIFSVLKHKVSLIIPRILGVDEQLTTTTVSTEIDSSSISNTQTPVPAVLPTEIIASNQSIPSMTATTVSTEIDSPSISNTQTPVPAVLPTEILASNQLIPSMQSTKKPISEIHFNGRASPVSELIVSELISPIRTSSLKPTQSTATTEGFSLSEGDHETKYPKPTELPNSLKERIDLTPSTKGPLLNLFNASTPLLQGVSIIQTPPSIIPIESTSTTEGSLLSGDAHFIDDAKPVTLTSNEETTQSTLATPSEPITPNVVPTIETKPSSEICSTPIGKNGVCQDLFQCNSLLSLIKQPVLLEEHKLYLKRSQCGRENKTILVCCPDGVESSIALESEVSQSKFSLLPKPRQCGNINENRLYGGYTTEIDSHSWLALLEYSKGGIEKGFHCGGALINDRYILTAAHCVAALPSTWSLRSVRLGEWDLSTDIDCSQHSQGTDCATAYIDVPIEEVIPHNGFEPTSNNLLHDIALVRLSIKVNSTDFIEPICLAQKNNHILHGFDDQSLDLVGWGARPDSIWSTVKQRVSSPVISLRKCNAKYAERNITLQPTQFCIEGRLRNDTCRIDSGGPAISFDTANKGLGSYYLAGIQSFGLSPCSAEEFPGVYTRVGEYIDWILENIRD